MVKELDCSLDKHNGPDSLTLSKCVVVPRHCPDHVTIERRVVLWLCLTSAALQGLTTLNDWERIVEHLHNTADPQKKEVLGPQVSEMFRFAALLLICCSCPSQWSPRADFVSEQNVPAFQTHGPQHVSTNSYFLSL